MYGSGLYSGVPLAASVASRLLITENTLPLILCGYVLNSFQRPTGNPHLRENLCRTLSRLFPVNGLSSTHVQHYAATLSPKWKQLGSWEQLRDFDARYPAARMESLPELRGTRAWIVVPRWGGDSIKNDPFTSLSRSCMLIKPSPRPAFAASRSKPAPESLTVR